MSATDDEQQCDEDDERAARERGGIEIPVARAVEEGLDGSGHFAEVDLDGAGLDAAVADRAVVGQIDELVEVLERKAAAGLHLPQRRQLLTDCEMAPRPEISRMRDSARKSSNEGV